MLGNRSVGTKPEMALRSAIHALGMRYRVNHRIRLADMQVRPDIVFVARRVCVFSDGCFWHRCPDHATDPKVNADYWREKLAANTARDQRVNAALGSAGWTIVRVWEHEDPAEAARRIASIVAARPKLGCS